jgi:endonuclease-3
MKRSEKATKIGAQLDRLYPQPPIPLRHVDPYTLLVAVLLSAQTTDARVNLVTPALFERAPTPAAMVQVPVAEILQMIRTCGLAPAKAKNIHRLSSCCSSGTAARCRAASPSSRRCRGSGTRRRAW